MLERRFGYGSGRAASNLDGRSRRVRALLGSRQRLSGLGKVGLRFGSQIGHEVSKGQIGLGRGSWKNLGRHRGRCMCWLALSLSLCLRSPSSRAVAPSSLLSLDRAAQDRVAVHCACLCGASEKVKKVSVFRYVDNVTRPIAKLQTRFARPRVVRGRRW